MQRMGQAYDHNMGVLQGGMNIQDSHITVHYRVLNDVAKGTVRLDQDGNLDATSYHLEFAAVMAVWALFERLKAVIEAAKVVEQVPEPAASNLVELPEFGGDNAAGA